LSQRPNGLLALELKSVWKDGARSSPTTCGSGSALPFQRRACLHLGRHFGVLSSHHALRGDVSPTPAPEPGMNQIDLGLAPDGLDVDAASARQASDQVAAVWKRIGFSGQDCAGPSAPSR
jgi:hypothetical protein